MELQSQILFKELPLFTESEYEASLMGKRARAQLLTLEDEKGYICFYLKARAQVKLLGLDYHFECLSRWEKEEDRLDFVSYEEKDFSKNIKKKWEFSSEGLSFSENKKGVFVERDVLYFGESARTNIFDPLSALVQLYINPLEDGEERSLNVFGKNSVIKIRAVQKEGEVSFQSTEGMNLIWSKMVSNLKIKTGPLNILEAQLPSPIGIGDLRLTHQGTRSIDTQNATELLKSFES